MDITIENGKYELSARDLHTGVLYEGKSQNAFGDPLTIYAYLKEDISQPSVTVVTQTNSAIYLKTLPSSQFFVTHSKTKFSL